MACSKVISDFEVLSMEDTGRRRDRSDAEKIQIVEESFRGHRQGSATARRYGILRSLLTRWRKEYRLGVLGNVPTTFTPLQIAPAPGLAASALTGALPGQPAVDAAVEITLANGRRLSVAPLIDATALTRLVRVLERA